MWTELRERLGAAPVPRRLRGAPITCLLAGMVSLALVGALGLRLHSDPMALPIIWLFFTVAIASALSPQSAPRLPPEPDALAARIDALLPQTQCTRCGFPACRPYAEAIACGEADINRCPPGGEAGIRKLAALLNQPFKPLDPECGIEKPPLVALIREAECIGCTKCIQACPVDAIVGASKLMHTVIADWCTGCELCIPPCPVDCIDLVDAPTPMTPQLIGWDRDTSSRPQ